MLHLLVESRLGTTARSVGTALRSSRSQGRLHIHSGTALGRLRQGTTGLNNFLAAGNDGIIDDAPYGAIVTTTDGTERMHRTEYGTTP